MKIVHLPEVCSSCPEYAFCLAYSNLHCPYYADLQSAKDNAFISSDIT